MLKISFSSQFCLRRFKPFAFGLNQFFSVQSSLSFDCLVLIWTFILDKTQHPCCHSGSFPNNPWQLMSTRFTTVGGLWTWTTITLVVFFNSSSLSGVRMSFTVSGHFCFPSSDDCGPCNHSLSSLSFNPRAPRELISAWFSSSGQCPQCSLFVNFKISFTYVWQTASTPPCFGSSKVPFCYPTSIWHD